jgi:hypothetical protein
MELEFSQIFEKFWNMKFHKNACSGSRVFHANGQTDMTKLKIAIRNFAYEPKKYFFIWPSIADRGTPGSEDGFPSVSGGDEWVRGEGGGG